MRHVLSIRRPHIAVGVALVVWAAPLAGCNSAGPSGAATANGRVQVVAAENFWGSIAAQLGGDRVRVSSIIVNPSTDPHSYEPTAQDARTMAGAKLAIVNGIGYDNWAPKLLAASPVSGRVVLNVGQLLGLKDGDNPHQWYSPASVQKVIDQIVADYDKLDPARTLPTSRSRSRPSRRRDSRATTSCVRRSARSTRARRSATARASSGRWAKTSD